MTFAKVGIFVFRLLRVFFISVIAGKFYIKSFKLHRKPYINTDIVVIVIFIFGILYSLN